VDLVDAALARIERWNPELDAFITVLADSARRQARAAEREIRRGRSRGLLHGIPIALKDNFWTRGIRTTAGAKILSDFVPHKDSDVAALLSRAGAILLGKTNMHEFAYGITGENPHFGTPRNPWERERITGGSSSGSAAAIATGMIFASVGTDTAGSIRIPSALCAIVGVKPTYGLVSTDGTVPLAHSFDHVGPMARSVVDACIVLEAIAGDCPKGMARLDHRKLRGRGRRFRLGLPKHHYFDRVDSNVERLVRAAADQFKSLGARIEEVPLTQLTELFQAAQNLSVAEASYYHESQGYYPARAADYGDDLRGHLQRGHELRAVEYLDGVEKLRQMGEDFRAAFERVDAILAPTSPIPAPRIGETKIRINGQEETAVRPELLRCTRPSNLTGLPSISVPCGFTPEGLPVGLQLIGPKWSEARLLSLALGYEDTTEWHKRHPDLG
jgi:aspartyl-tRNA(Asn)/glutamyl-tRNA(Gln) amidotransferase subunit A